MLRRLDMALAALGLVMALPFLAVLLVIGWLDTRSPLFVQQRVGRQQQAFNLYKLRTMRLGTESVATHLANPEAITRFGSWLRRTKLDELPQLWNVLMGEMSLVGPRPCLFSQHELIEARQNLGVFDARPGITGWAQLSGIDMSAPERLAQVDAAMLSELNVQTYCTTLLYTVTSLGQGDPIKSASIPGVEKRIKGQ